MKENPKSDLLVKANAAQHKLLGKRFCSSCQSMRPIDEGEIIGNKVKRWKCSLCLNKASIRKYQSVKTKED